MSKFFASETSLFLKAATSSVGINGLSLLIGMVGSILLTRALGAEGRGLLAWITSLSSIATVILQFGIGQASRRFVAEDSSRAGDMAILTVLLSVAGAAIILPCFILYGLNAQIAEKYHPLVLIGMLIAPIMAINVNLSDLLLGLRKNFCYNIHLLTQKTINSLLVVLLIILGSATPTYAILALMVSYIAQLLLVVSFIKHEIKNRLRDMSWIINNLKSYITASYIAHLLQIISTSLIPILIASISGVKEAGLFAAPMIFIDAARASINMVSMHTLPHIAQAADKLEKVRRIKHSLYITLFFSVGAAIIFYISAGWVLSLLFGEEFVQSANILKVLAIGLIFISIHNTLLSIIASMFEGVRLVFSSAVVAVLANLLCAILASRYGAMAGAISFLLANFVACIVASLCFMRRY